MRAGGHGVHSSEDHSNRTRIETWGVEREMQSAPESASEDHSNRTRIETGRPARKSGRDPTNKLPQKTIPIEQGLKRTIGMIRVVGIWALRRPFQ